MAVAQQEQEEIANRTRQQAQEFQEGNKVQLNLRNIRTTRQSKKLDQKNIKYTIIKVIGSYSYYLNTPPGIYNIFHLFLLRTASLDPFESQVSYNTQLDPVIVGDDEEY